MKALFVPITVLALAVAAPVTQAQGAPLAHDSSTTPVATRVESAPRRDNAVAGFRLDRASREYAVGSTAGTLQDAPPTGRARLYMVVGGAAFVGGLLIGDDAGTAIAVVGLGIGIYGLYLYMR